MKAKEYLQQLEKINVLIENKFAEKAHWESIAIGASSRLTADKVQSSGNPQRMADAISEYIDIEMELAQQIELLKRKRKEIISVIEQLDYMDYDLLHKRYVQGIDFKEIAFIRKQSYSNITTLHGIALKKVQYIIDNMEFFD